MKESLTAVIRAIQKSVAFCGIRLHVIFKSHVHPSIIEPIYFSIVVHVENYAHVIKRNVIMSQMVYFHRDKQRCLIRPLKGYVHPECCDIEFFCYGTLPEEIECFTTIGEECTPH